MVETILWSLGGLFTAGCAGFGVGWRLGRRRLRASLKENSTTNRFLKLLNY